jgi:hypothetical protein
MRSELYPQFFAMYTCGTSSMESPNVVLVVLDCVRLKNLSWGDAPLTARTPNLDRVARDGVFFDHAIAPANWTVPSHFSMLTGLYPHEHAVTRTGRRLPQGVPTLAQELSARGYETALFTEQSHLAFSGGLSGGYATIRATSPARPEVQSGRHAPEPPSTSARLARSRVVQRLLDLAPASGIPIAALVQLHRARLKRRLSPDSLSEQAAAWIRARPKDAPYHLLANFVDAHEPYAFGPMLDGGFGLRDMIAMLPAWYLMTVPGVHRSASPAALERGYVAGIEAADRKLGQLLDAVDASPSAERTLVVVTSDHGQQFGEAGNFYHAGGVTDAVARVPLVVRAPWATPAGRVEHRWTSVRQVYEWCCAPSAPASLVGSATDPSDAVTMLRSDPVWCEGSPAWEVSSSFASAERDPLWNRRLVASYVGDQKWTLDVATGRVWRSTPALRSRAEAPILCDPEDARWALQSLFPKTTTNVADRGAPPPANSGASSAVGRTLASWGY